jgi:predicted enzyme related to lactoylglutathione lyase
MTTMTENELVISLDEIPETLTSSDRCDGCSAQAKHVAVLTSGKVLYFCGHHTARHMDKIVADGGQIITPFR